MHDRKVIWKGLCIILGIGCGTGSFCQSFPLMVLNTLFIGTALLYPFPVNQSSLDSLTQGKSRLSFDQSAQDFQNSPSSVSAVTPKGLASIVCKSKLLPLTSWPPKFGEMEAGALSVLLDGGAWDFLSKHRPQKWVGYNFILERNANTVLLVTSYQQFHTKFYSCCKKPGDYPKSTILPSIGMSIPTAGVCNKLMVFAFLKNGRSCCHLWKWHFFRMDLFQRG